MNFWWVFIYDHGSPEGFEAQIIPESKLTGPQRWELEGNGWTLMWDSAPSRQAAIDFCEDAEATGLPWGAYERACTGCGNFSYTNLYRGQQLGETRWGKEGMIPFNGYLCEQCAADTYCFKIRMVE